MEGCKKPDKFVLMASCTCPMKNLCDSYTKHNKFNTL